MADAEGLGSRRILRLATAFAAQAALFDLPGPSAFCGKARDAASVRPMRKDIHERVRRHVVFPKTRRFASVASSARPRGASRTSDTDSAYNYFSASLRLSHGLSQILLDTILMASCPPRFFRFLFFFLYKYDIFLTHCSAEQRRSAKGCACSSNRSRSDVCLHTHHAAVCVQSEFAY